MLERLPNPLALPANGALLQMLADELARGDRFAAETAGRLAQLMLQRLARRRAHDAVATNPLTASTLAQLSAFVDAQLDQPLRVADLAAIAGLSCNRFAAAFGAAVGETPHQFVLTRRTERAVALLRQTAEPLADIAAACGFASQQHMTQHLRQRLGITLARLRTRQWFVLKPCTSRCSQALKTM